MRPTLAEQLRGLQRILETTVQPAIAAEYPSETLSGVLRALDMLARRVAEVGPFLEWDNRATRALLASIEPHIPVAGPLDPETPLAPGDLAALEAENERLRNLLAAAIPALAADEHAADVHRAVVAHLRERIARYPYASTGSLPAR
jgi:hypothetical protein